MQTTTALYGVLVVYGCVLAGLLLFVTVLAFVASRSGHSVRVDLDLRRLRLKVELTPTRSRNVGGPSAPGD
jgi:hypothetical protein